MKNEITPSIIAKEFLFHMSQNVILEGCYKMTFGFIDVTAPLAFLSSELKLRALLLSVEPDRYKDNSGYFRTTATGHVKESYKNKTVLIALEHWKDCGAIVKAYIEVKPEKPTITLDEIKVLKSIISRFENAV
jgi:hypothetical protein